LRITVLSGYCAPEHEATEWLHVNVQEDAQWFGGALVVEPRYVANLVDGLSEEGFAVV
jgi:hypothetical protein